MKPKTENTPWIQTVSGRKFPLDQPDVHQIDIGDIAHALSLLVRFNGHCTKFHSVAEHSVHVSRETATELALVRHMHGAAETYPGDVPSPLKVQLSQFSAFEHKMEASIGQRFGIDPAMFKSTELKRADVQLLVDEKAVLMAAPPEPWPPGAPLVKDLARIEAWGPEVAKARFLHRFAELG